MAGNLPEFPLDLVAPTLFVEKVVSQFDKWGMMRVRPSRRDTLAAVRIVVIGQDPFTKEHLGGAEVEERFNSSVDGKQTELTAATNPERPCRGKRLGEYSNQELVSLLEAEGGNISHIARRLGVSPKYVRFHLQKRGLRAPGLRTR